MKHRKINILTALAFGAVITFTGCSKDDGAIPKRIKIEDIPAVTTNTEKPVSQDTIRLGNQAAFEGKFKVALYFAGALPPTKVDVVVRKNGSAANVKLFQAAVTSLPTSFTVTAAQIATLFGTPIALNDTYDFAPDIYVGDRKYEAFPAVGLGNGQGITGMNTIGFGEFVRYPVKN